MTTWERFMRWLTGYTPRDPGDHPTVRRIEQRQRETARRLAEVRAALPPETRAEIEAELIARRRMDHGTGPDGHDRLR